MQLTRSERKIVDDLEAGFHFHRDGFRWKVLNPRKPLMNRFVRFVQDRTMRSLVEKRVIAIGPKGGYVVNRQGFKEGDGKCN